MQDGEEEAPSISVTLTSIDYYLAPPLPALDVQYSPVLGAPLQRVPVLRIFGASSVGGRKTCLHLHRVFPYLLVPTIDSWPARPCEGLHTRVCQLAKSVEQALRENQRLQAEERQEAGAGGAGSAGFRPQDRQHVLKAQVVRGVPFYGCHLSERLFVKIYFIDPADVQKAAGLLLGGACMGHAFQVFHSHIPYVLQAMADLNLVGMGTVNLRSITFREPRLQVPRQHSAQHAADAIPPHTLAKLEAQWAYALSARPAMVTNGYDRMSVCSLEGDALASDVMNADRVKRLRLTELNRGTKMVETLAYIWDDVRKHNKDIGEGTTLDVPLSSARSHSCTPLGMAAVFGETLKAQAEKEACPPGQGFVVPADERVAALAPFKANSELNELDAHGADAADLRQEMLADAAAGRAQGTADATEAAAKASTTKPVVDSQMLRQLSLSMSRSQRHLSQRLSSRRSIAHGGSQQQSAAGVHALDAMDGRRTDSQRSENGDGAGGGTRISGSGGGISLTPQSQEVLDVFAWMAMEDEQDQGLLEEDAWQEEGEEAGEEEFDTYDPVKERVRELQMNAEMLHAHDILQCTQV